MLTPISPFTIIFLVLALVLAICAVGVGWAALVIGISFFNEGLIAWARRPDKDKVF